jgi:ribosomal protein S6--L-glutamate ligase
MKRPRTLKVTPEASAVPAAELALELGLPSKKTGTPRLLIGRREWIGLPGLGVSPLNTKTDSGARSSSLHAEDIVLSPDGSRVNFVTTDHYGNRISCEAAVVGSTRVRSSSGVARRRIFIETEAVLAGGFRWRIRLTLANRERMRCPMLLGRRALAGYFLIDPQGSHLLGGVRELERYVPGTRPA